MNVDPSKHCRPANGLDPTTKKRELLRRFGWLIVPASGIAALGATFIGLDWMIGGMPSLSRSNLLAAANGAAFAFATLYLGASGYVTWIQAGTRRRVATLFACGVTALAFALVLAVKLGPYPDEACWGGAISTFGERDAYRELDKVVTRNAEYVLFFDERGSAGDAPMPMVGIHKTWLVKPRVVRCDDQGTVFEWWLPEAPKTAKLRPSLDVIDWRGRDGAVQTIRVPKKI